MPFKKTSRRTPPTKKRTYRRKKKSANYSTRKALVQFSSGTQLFAPKYIAKLPYAQAVSLGSGQDPDIANFYVFRAASINDPNLTGAGHQPRGHDELALFYAHYRVLGAKITITGTLKTPSAANNMLIFLNRTAAQPASASEFTIEEILENPTIKRAVLTAEKPTAKLTEYYSARKVFGSGKLADLTTTFNSNPAEEQYFNFGHNNYAYGSAQSAVDFMVQVEYIVLCTERKKTSSS